MAREGTRSATGNSKPRVFDTPDTAPVIARKPKSKTTTTKSAKPVGVTKTKKVTPAKKARTPSLLLPARLLSNSGGTHLLQREISVQYGRPDR